MARKNLLALLLLFSVVSFWNFSLPGIQMDEVNHAAFIPGMFSVQAARQHHYRMPDNYYDREDKRPQWPIVGGSIYNTAVTAYLGIPFFKTFGFSFTSLRVFQALVGFAAVLAAFLLLRSLFGSLSAWIFAAAVMLDPLMVFSLRSQGFYFWYIILFTLLAAHCLQHWRKAWQPSAGWAFWAGVFTGLAAMSYFVGLFIAVPFAVFALLVFRSQRKAVLAFLLGGVLGYLPLLYALGTLYVLDANLLNYSELPHFARREHIALFGDHNIQRWLGLVVKGIGSFEFASGVVGRFDAATHYLRLLILCGSALAGLAYAVGWSWKDRETQVFFQLTTAMLACFALGSFLLKGVGAHHLVPVYFLLLFQLAALAGQLSWQGFITAALAIVLVIGNGVSLIRAHHSLSLSEGRGFHNVIYQAAAEDTHGEFSAYHPVFVSWGMHLQYLFLTGGEQAYTFMPRPAPEKLTQLLEQHERLLLYVAPADRENLPDLSSLLTRELERRVPYDDSVGYTVILLEQP